MKVCVCLAILVLVVGVVTASRQAQKEHKRIDRPHKRIDRPHKRIDRPHKRIDRPHKAVASPLKRSLLHERLARILKKQTKRGDCNALGATCTGYAWDKCCDDNTCYWEDGRSLLDPGREGTCVTCIGNNNACQFDWQCCSPYVCHRESRTDTNGKCGAKKGSGESCHEDDNCASGECDFNWSFTGTCQ